MRRIFIDLEMNPVSGEHADFRKQCRSEVIEIGAVVMDEQMHITDQFREYVKPEYNSVVLKKITRLTGISTETVSEAESFQPVFLRFLAWCGAEDYEICSWSDNDIWQLMKELSAKQVPDAPGISYMLNHWRDIQDDFRSTLHMERLTSLQNAIDLAGLDFDGKAHDALNDARNTALLFKASKDSDSFARMKKAYDEAMTPHVFTFADVFDFRSLQLA
jgi:inhibitor of KinA sporulation pathway (predicted exonuclease)